MIELATVLVSAALSCMVAWFTAKWQLARSREERSQQRLEAAYRGAARFAIEAQRLAYTHDPKWPAADIDTDVARGTFAEIELFGSDLVRDALARLRIQVQLLLYVINKQLPRAGSEDIQWTDEQQKLYSYAVDSTWTEAKTLLEALRPDMK